VSRATTCIAVSRAANCIAVSRATNCITESRATTCSIVSSAPTCIILTRTGYISIACRQRLDKKERQIFVKYLIIVGNKFIFMFLI
jgi:hypothetical protein